MKHKLSKETLHTIQELERIPCAWDSVFRELENHAILYDDQKYGLLDLGWQEASGRIDDRLIPLAVFERKLDQLVQEF